MIHRLDQRPQTSGRHQPIKFHKNYDNQRDRYIQDQGPTQAANIQGRGRCHITTKAMGRPLQVNPISPQELQSRLNETRSAQVVAFVQVRNKQRNWALNYSLSDVLNRKVKHLMSWNSLPIRYNISCKMVTSGSAKIVKSCSNDCRE